MFEAAKLTGANLVQLLHTSQRTELVRPWPAEGEMRTQASVRGVWDMKVGALLIVDTTTEVNGELAAKFTELSTDLEAFNTEPVV